MIVFKCENKDCTYPDYKESYPTDDNIICRCGATAMGHYSNVEDLAKKLAFEEEEREYEDEDVPMEEDDPSGLYYIGNYDEEEVAKCPGCNIPSDGYCDECENDDPELFKLMHPEEE